ncbi:MAG: ATP-binding protein [Prevotellaceae bacterium]|nr:ATP-binding protein [Prevotellaceae bacterium]
MVANYIKKIEIDSLWNGRKRISWQLNPEVNILSGVNGMGKTTILNRVVDSLHRLNKRHADKSDGTAVTLTFSPEEADEVRYDVVRSFDNTMIPASIAQKLTDGLIRSELDWNLYELQRRYLDYQVNIGNRMIEILSSGGADAHQEAMQVSKAKTDFHDTIDTLFCETHKTIDRSSNELMFVQYGERLAPYRLSSGEKQMLIILLTVLLQNRQPYVLLMDEPEASLHVEWQQRLVGIIRRMNPNVQIILTTHSPALIMDGWLDSVTEVSDIVVG